MEKPSVGGLPSSHWNWVVGASVTMQPKRRALVMPPAGEMQKVEVSWVPLRRIWPSSSSPARQMKLPTLQLMYLLPVRQ